MEMNQEDNQEAISFFASHSCDWSFMNHKCSLLRLAVTSSYDKLLFIY
jgi:hypothetical protein